MLEPLLSLAVMIATAVCFGLWQDSISAGAFMFFLLAVVSRLVVVSVEAHR